MTTLLAVLLSAASPMAAPENVLLDFSASWCGPCQQMSPIVSRLQRQGYPIRKVDIDRDQALASKYRISSVPAFVLVMNGREVTRIVGMTSERRLKSLLARIPPRQPVIRAKLGRGESARVGTNAANPLAPCTRIRVQDDSGVNYGSGTIIDSRPGRTVVLTCGHILRDLSRQSKIEVDVFVGKNHETFVGKAVRYDLDADVGLIAIGTESLLPVAKVATAAARVSRDDRVYSVGCSGGEPPTKLQLRVTALNRYLGPDNIECTGVPMQGRSGGGLFNKAGEVVGVCVAADPRDHRGLYAGLEPIYALLDRSKLASLYQRSNPSSQNDGRPGDQPPEPLRSLAKAKHQHSFPQGKRTRDNRADLTSLNTSAESPRRQPAQIDGPSHQDGTVCDAIEGVGEAEVVCVIRPLDNPQAASRVVIINRASPKFVSYLARELNEQARPTMRSVAFAGPKRLGGTAGLPSSVSSGAVDQPGTAGRASSGTRATPAEPQRYRRSLASR